MLPAQLYLVDSIILFARTQSYPGPCPGGHPGRRHVRRRHPSRLRLALIVSDNCNRRTRLHPAATVTLSINGGERWHPASTVSLSKKRCVRRLRAFPNTVRHQRHLIFSRNIRPGVCRLYLISATLNGSNFETQPMR